MPCLIIGQMHLLNEHDAWYRQNGEAMQVQSWVVQPDDVGRKELFKHMEMNHVKERSYLKT